MEPAGSSSAEGAPLVVVFDQLDYLGWSYEIEEEILTAAGARLWVPPRSEGHAALAGADVVIVHDGPFGAAELALLHHPAGIVCYSVGMDQVDAAAASAAGVPVHNLPHWATQVVAEHALTLLLAAIRRLPVQDRAARTQQWDHRRLIADLGIELFTDLTVGIIGAGRIGTAVAARAMSLGFEVLATDPDRSDRKPNVPLVPLDELLGSVDAVVICAPLTDETRRLMNAAAFSKMRRGAVLVNVSRGGIVDEEALAAALSDGTLAFAALDVRATEPPSPDDPLLEQPNLLLTPHTAWVARASHHAYHVEAANVAVELLRSAGRLDSRP